MARLRQLWQSAALGHPDDEQSRPNLRYAVVGSVQHLGAEVIASVVDPAQQPLVGRSAGLVLVRERVDVLQDEGPRLRLSQNAGVGLQQAGAGVETIAFPVQPEPGLGERCTRRATHKQIRALAFPQASTLQDLARGRLEDVLAYDRRDQM